MFGYKCNISPKYFNMSCSQSTKVLFFVEEIVSVRIVLIEVLTVIFGLQLLIIIVNTVYDFDVKLLCILTAQLPGFIRIVKVPELIECFLEDLVELLDGWLLFHIDCLASHLLIIERI